jgi:MYXO-CTERM domain-containing protein
MRAAVVALVLVVAARDASAFETGDQFDLDPLTETGAGGIAFDGAPRWAGHTCAVCHTEAPGLVNLRLEADHPELFTDGWKPNQQYHLRVVLSQTWADEGNRAIGDNCGEKVTPYRPCDHNGFAIELADSHGKPIGTLAQFAATACVPPTMTVNDADVRILTDRSAATHSGIHNGQIAWDLCWTAPAAGAGVITAYLAAVDGSGGNGTTAFISDSKGDDVASGAVPLPELGGEPQGQTGGCAAAGGDPQLALALAMLALLLVRGARRRELAVIAALAAITGCTHVRAHQRETLARRNMQFAPDPTEDELDLHMQNSREGASGGYGSSGGGCGCN